MGSDLVSGVVSVSGISRVLTVVLDSFAVQMTFWIPIEGISRVSRVADFDFVSVSGVFRIPDSKFVDISGVAEMISGISGDSNVSSEIAFGNSRVLDSNNFGDFVGVADDIFVS